MREEVLELIDRAVVAGLSAEAGGSNAAAGLSTVTSDLNSVATVPSLAGRRVDCGLLDKKHEAVSSTGLTRDEAELLYALDAHAPEAYYLHWGAHELAWRASAGRGAIYAQIGLDAQPCAGNCHYCSFAEINGSFSEKVSLPTDIVLRYCRALSDAGAHLISLMTTADYPLKRFFEIARAVRQVIRPDIALMANIGDFDLQQAGELKRVGIDTVYHAIRIGEGHITAIPEQRRRDTIQAVYDADLRLMSGVEPVYVGQEDALVLDRMMEVATLPQICSGICQLRVVEGTRMATTQRCSIPRYQLLGSLFRLMAGVSIPYGSESTRWCNYGTNPRDTKMFPGEKNICDNVASARLDLEEHGWLVP